MTTPETTEPTLDDLLTACDLAEEGGAPPKVVAALKYAVVIWGYHKRAQVVKIAAEDAHNEMVYSISSGQDHGALAELRLRYPVKSVLTSP
jgi:hypothetical protein